MTSPYYNHPSISVHKVNEQTTTDILDHPIEYDTCSACNKIGTSNNPTIATMIDDEVIFECRDCSI